MSTPATDRPSSTTTTAPRWIDLGLLLLLATLWGCAYTFTKVAVESIPPLTIAAVRVTVAGALLGVYIAFRGERIPRNAETWRRLFVQGCLNSVIPFSLIAWGQQYIDSGLAGILNATPPLFVLLITWLWTRHEPITGRKLAGVVSGLAGVTLIIGVDALGGFGTHTLAQIAITVASVSYAGAVIYGHRLSYISPAATAAGTLICGTLILVPASLALEAPWTLTPSLHSVLAVAALAVFSTGIALMIYFRLLRTLGSMGLASNSYLRAGISVLLGVVFLGEQLTAPMIGGLVLIVAGVVAIVGIVRRD